MILGPRPGQDPSLSVSVDIHSPSLRETRVGLTVSARDIQGNFDYLGGINLNKGLSSELILFVKVFVTIFSARLSLHS